MGDDFFLMVCVCVCVCVWGVQLNTIFLNEEELDYEISITVILINLLNIIDVIESIMTCLS